MILGMSQTAAAIGLSYERFRKVRRALIACEDFPAPVIGCRWEAEAVQAWVRARSARRITVFQVGAHTILPRRGLEHQRRQLEDLRST